MLTTPYVGLIVDYYPDQSTRSPAMVVNTKPSPVDETRPIVDLTVFTPEGEICFKANVPPATMQLDGDSNDLEGKWAFAHEMAVDAPEDTDPQDQEGINTNIHVGTVQTTDQY